MFTTGDDAALAIGKLAGMCGIRRTVLQRKFPVFHLNNWPAAGHFQDMSVQV